jgi:hypothetical protein
MNAIQNQRLVCVKLCFCDFITTNEPTNAKNLIMAVVVVMATDSSLKTNALKLVLNGTIH